MNPELSRTVPGEPICCAVALLKQDCGATTSKSAKKLGESPKKQTSSRFLIRCTARQHPSARRVGVNFPRSLLCWGAVVPFIFPCISTKIPRPWPSAPAHILAAACEEAVAERGVFKIALSGGQTPIPLFRLLAADDWADRLPWDKMTFFWVDERCVGPEHPDSNYGLARRELLSRVPATHFFRMRGGRRPGGGGRQVRAAASQRFQPGSAGVAAFRLHASGHGRRWSYRLHFSQFSGPGRKKTPGH